MKLVKILAAASLVLASAQAMAFTPPYYISGTPIVGTATFKSSGGCKIAPKKFTNAQFGSVYDANDDAVGQGVISSNGAEVLGVVSGNLVPGLKYQFVDETLGAQRVKFDYMYSMVGEVVASYLQQTSGCSLLALWPSPTSSLSQDLNQAKGTITINIKQAFVGYSGTEEANCKEKAPNTTCKLSKVTGGFTFKGTQSLAL